jgi:lipopolysaccharide transport system ATP-binding protein
VHRVVCEIPGGLLNDGTITITPLVVSDGTRVVCAGRDAITVQISDAAREGGWLGKWPGAVRPMSFRWDRAFVGEGDRSGAPLERSVAAAGAIS